MVLLFIRFAFHNLSKLVTNYKQATSHVKRAFAELMSVSVGPLYDQVTWYKITHAGCKLRSGTFKTMQHVPAQLDVPLFCLPAQHAHQHV